MKQHSGIPVGSITADRWSEQVGTLLDEQCRLCRELDRLSEGQSEVVRAGDTERVLRVLSERQAIVDEIARVNEKLEPLRGVWEAGLNALAVGERAALRAKVDELGEIVSRVDQRDEADRAVLEAQRAVVSKEMSDVTRVRGAANAYARNGTVAGAQYQDRTG